MDVNTLIKQAHDSVDQLEDQTKVQEAGDFDNTPPEGKTMARFVGYVEVGKRKQKPYQGKEKPDADEVRLYFELNGPKHCRTVEVEGEEKTFTNLLTIKLTKKLSDKATFVKLFNKMVYGREGIKHMAAMLGEGFIVKIVHNTVKGTDGAKDRVYANMRDSSEWFIEAPMFTDPMSDVTTNVPVPEATQPIKLLLWDAPTQEQWDSIFIDGTRTVKDKDGTEREESKNWLQEDVVQNAVNFEGSPLQAILGGVGDLNLDQDDEVIEAPDEEPDTTEAPEEENQPVEKADEAPQEPAKETAKSSGAEDLLAELGL